MREKIWLSLFVVCWFNCVGQNKISEISNYEGNVKKIKINTEEIAYVEEGRGSTTLLFIHGLSSNLKAWAKNVDELKKSYTCIALDLPGYGKSSRNSTTYSLEQYAEFMEAFVQAKGLKNVIPVGHSMGGQIAITAVLNYSNAFDKLILIAPAGIETFTAQESQIMKASYSPEMLMASTPEQVKVNYQMNFYSFPDDAAFMVRDRLEMAKAEDFPQYAGVVVSNISAMLDEPVFEKLREIPVPVLMIFGKDDMLIPNKYFHPEQSINSLVEDAKERIENLEVALIEEAGHFVNFEKAKQVNSIISAFIKTE